MKLNSLPEMTPMQKSNAIEKALDVLNAFVPYNQELGTMEVSQQLGLHKATASRILITLTNKGFLQQNPQTKKYRLGPSSLDLGRAVAYSLNGDIVQLAKPLLDDLRSELKETVVLEIFSGGRTVMAYIAEGPQRVRIAGTVGDRLPSHSAAGSKAILAYSSPEIVDSVLENKLSSFTPHTITDPVLIRQELREVRKKGYSVDREEIDIGINAIGAPIFNHDDEPVAAVVVAGPSQRIKFGNSSAIVSSVKDCATRISALLQSKGKAVSK